MLRINTVPTLLASMVIFCVLATSAHAGPKLLFDQGHGQLFFIERNGDLDLSRFAETFRGTGYDVTSATVPLSVELLTGIDVLVLSGAFRPYTPTEIEAISAFVEHGGRLCIMLHIGPPLMPLLLRFGVEHSISIIREQENIIDNNPIDFRVTRLADHPLFQGLQQFSLYGVWALHETHPGIKAIAVTSSAAWIDLNRNGRLDPSDVQQSFAVAVAGEFGKGKIIVFGDDAIFQNKFLVADNLSLGRNLAVWLANGTLPTSDKKSSP